MNTIEICPYCGAIDEIGEDELDNEYCKDCGHIVNSPETLTTIRVEV